MTTASPTILLATSDADEVCGACQHPRRVHDTTGLRFCAATTNTASTRNCICRGV